MTRTIACFLLAIAVGAACVHGLHYTLLGGCIVAALLMYVMVGRREA